MSQFNNQLPEGVTIRYTAVDGTQPMQVVKAHSHINSAKNVQPHSQVKVTTTSQSTKNTHAPANADQATLQVVQDAGNAWHLQWA